ncbi:hypothetical protein MU582_20260 [Nocardioidaceae bacterium SCSIO 66511]|nr:hypothetical protein MU582_20260 [Nocardioidaceae bacterium SCSIO 66511]
MRRLAMFLVAVAAVVAGAAPASAIDDSKGTPGFCPDGDGVTVVVDFGSIGGDVVVRCAPGSQQRDGLDALRDAGFLVDGTSRFGAGAVCRIEGRPGAGESLAVDGDDGYREACVDMPPSSAYWSYWGAENGGDWAYSQRGLQNREAIVGGFEGWSFALNETRSSPSAPRIDPVRPDDDTGDSDGAESSEGATTDESDQGSKSDDGQTDGGASDDSTDSTGDSGAGLPMPKKRDVGSAPTEGAQDGVKWTGGEDTESAASADVDPESSSAAPWAAAGVIAGIGVLIAVTVVRRRASQRLR